jgi:hypothetical protein
VAAAPASPEVLILPYSSASIPKVSWRAERQLDSLSLLRSILALLAALLAALAALTALLFLPGRLILTAGLTLLLPGLILPLSRLVLMALVLLCAIAHLVFSGDTTSGTLERRLSSRCRPEGKACGPRGLCARRNAPSEIDRQIVTQRAVCAILNAWHVKYSIGMIRCCSTDS